VSQSSTRGGVAASAGWRKCGKARRGQGDALKDRNSGERKQRTEWHRVVIFSEGLGEIVEEYLANGANLNFSVRPNGAVHQWRKDPPRKLSVGPGS